MDFVYQPIAHSDGKMSGIFVEGFDVTERKLAEDALHELNASLAKGSTKALRSCTPGKL